MNVNSLKPKSATQLNAYHLQLLHQQPKAYRIIELYKD